MPDDLDMSKVASRKFTTNINSAIDIGRIGLTPRNEIAALEARHIFILSSNQAMFPGMNSRGFKFAGLRFAFDQDFERAANK